MGFLLQDIQQALQTTRSNVAAKWVEGEKDEYTVAWHELAHPGQRCEQSRCIFQPTTGRMVKKLLREKRSVPTATAQEVGIAELWEAHSEGVVPGEEEREQTMKIIAEGPARSSSYQLDELHVCFSTQKKQNNWLSATSLQFLKTTTWHDNGSIINEQGKELTKREFPEIRPARLQEIKVQVETEPTMTGEHVAVILVPMKEGKKLQNHFRQAAKWCRNVLLSIPWQVWQQEQTTIEPIGIPKLMSRLRWIQGRNSREVVAEQEVNGQWSEVLQIEKNANELSWRIKRVEARFQQSEDFATMEEWIFLKGIAIKANPLTAEYPWGAQQGIHADNLNFNIRKQRSRYFKKQSGYNKKAVRDKLEKYEKTSKWGKAAMTQSPQQMWKRQGIFTDYQNWTIYRMAVGSLNLFHAGWPEYQDCPDFECQCTQETPDHIIWECDKAQAAWTRWMGKWLGYTPSIEDRQSLMHHAAARLAPHPTTQFIAKARGFTARWYKDHEEAMAMIWLIWSTVTPVLLWRLRNKAVFDGKISTTEETQDIIWAAGKFQVAAVAKAWQARPETKIKGFYLEMCLDMMQTHNVVELEEGLHQWLIRFYIKREQEQNISGAWMLYKLEEKDQWRLHTAGTSYFISTGGRTSDAEEVVQPGLEHLIVRSEPHQVLLRVETMEATARRQQQAAAIQQETKFRQLLNGFFGVHWGKPPLQALRDCKQLAATKTNTTHQFQTELEDPLPDYKAWDEILREEPRSHEAQPTWKTESMKNRLIAYEASIGT